MSLSPETRADLLATIGALRLALKATDEARLPYASKVLEHYEAQEAYLMAHDTLSAALYRRWDVAALVARGEFLLDDPEVARLISRFAGRAEAAFHEQGNGEGI